MTLTKYSKYLSSCVISELRVREGRVRQRHHSISGLQTILRNPSNLPQLFPERTRRRYSVRHRAHLPRGPSVRPSVRSRALPRNGKPLELARGKKEERVRGRGSDSRMFVVRHERVQE